VHDRRRPARAPPRRRQARQSPARARREPLPGQVGIAHTRWATHGAPTVGNAHPHVVEGVAVVHNGIIENFKPLREEMQAKGRSFESETDTEVVAHLVADQLALGKAPRDAVAAVLPRLHGAFALAILFRDHPGMIVGARLGAPLTIGYGEGENYLGSDALALAPDPPIAYLDEGDWAVVTHDEVEIFDRDNNPVSRETVESGASSVRIDKGNHTPFHAEGDLRAAGRRRPDARLLSPPARAEGGAAADGLLLRAGAPRHHRRLRHFLLCRAWSPNIGSSASPACRSTSMSLSEFRYREPVLEPGGLALFISQSGETADTLAALRHARAQGQKIAVVVNVPTSSMAREADLLLPTHAGPEIGVASTKAFTCQLAVLAALAAKVARDKGMMSAEEEREIVEHLSEAPAAMNAALAHDEDIAAMAPLIAKARDVLYLGRGQDYPLALEGRAEAQGDQLHPRRGLCRRRDEARADRADRRCGADHRHRPFRAFVREDRLQHAGGAGARRQGRLISDAEGIAVAGENSLATIEMPKVHPADRAAGLCGAGAAPRLSCRRREGHRRRSARNLAKPSNELRPGESLILSRD
jgi:glucosamine--fructose-6-phosphate aminotransferase (isomerizing)